MTRRVRRTSKLGFVPATEQTSVAYFGPAGTFTEMATDVAVSAGLLPAEVVKIAAPSPSAALAALTATGSDRVDYAVVPIESSVEGGVPATLDALATGAELQILGEVSLPITFTLATRPGAQQIDTVAAYPVAAGQVREWMTHNLPDAVVAPAASNAAAAADVAAGRADAAVTTALAASAHGLSVYAANVADIADASTRFVIVGRPGPLPDRTGNDRTSVVLDLPAAPGSLALVMAEFALRGIDLMRLESRPTKAAIGTYFFYLDCVGHVQDSTVAQALAAIKGRAIWVRFLGSWAASDRLGAERAPRVDVQATEWITQILAGRRA